MAEQVPWVWKEESEPDRQRLQTRGGLWCHMGETRCLHVGLRQPRGRGDLQQTDGRGRIKLSGASATHLSLPESLQQRLLSEHLLLIHSSEAEAYAELLTMTVLHWQWQPDEVHPFLDSHWQRPHLSPSPDDSGLQFQMPDVSSKLCHFSLVFRHTVQRSYQTDIWLSQTPLGDF